MLLTHCQIGPFKSVTEPTSFGVDQKVTALVGKNESGKTVSLQAIHRVKPISSGHPVGFESLRDYPRRYRSRDKSQIGMTEPVSLIFDIGDKAAGAVEEMFGPSALSSRTVRVSRRYDTDTSYWSVSISQLEAVRFLVARAGLDADKFAQPDNAATVAALRADQSEAAELLATDLEKRDVSAEIRSILAGHLPRFQYFDEYNVLPGTVSIRRLQNSSESDLNPGERTALALLRLAGVDNAEFSQADYEPRKAALEAASATLTDELLEFWTQNPDLEIDLDIDFRPNPQGNPNPDPWLQIRVRNRKHRVTLNMSERSKGFIWFFSFLAAFSEYSNEERRILLLDEPGLNLHAKAQNDLLRFIDERLSHRHQVIYSTHSLFMIDPDRLDRCRTVEDLPQGGTSISNELWKARPETVFPILGALGVDMAQTLVIGPEQLVVEGPADLVYLNIMSEILRAERREELDSRWTITPAGGIDKIPTFVALLGGSSLRITVLMDGAVGGHQKLVNLVERGLLEDRRLIPLTEFTHSSEADIEDLFDPIWYLQLLRAAKIGSVTKSQLTGGRIVKQVEAALGKSYNHYAPAAHLLRSQGANLTGKIDDGTKDRFEALFRRLNLLLS